MSHENVSHAKAIFGPNISGLKGRATRKRTHRVVRGRCKIPRDFYLLNKFVTLTADVLRDYEQGLALVETVRKNMGGFAREEVEGAKLSRQTQGRVGNPPDAVFKQLIGTKDLKNNPVSLKCISR